MKLATVQKIFAAYIIGFILTFGYSYNHDYEQPMQFFDPNPIRAFACALMWPVYLSKVAFEGMRHDH